MITRDYTNPFLHKFHQKYQLEQMHRIDASAVVDDLIREIEKGDTGSFMGNRASEAYAEAIQSIINTPEVGSAYESINKIQSPHEVWQEVTYIPSNLQGHIFYFICSGCREKAKYLYSPKPGMRSHYKCRTCWRLRYPKKKDPNRKLTYNNPIPYHRFG